MSSKLIDMEILSNEITEELNVANEQISMTKPTQFDGRSYWLGRRDALNDLLDEFQEQT